ncbi:MAG: O-antigen ligase family protein [Acidimicrobiia bacterium]
MQPAPGSETRSRRVVSGVVVVAAAALAGAMAGRHPFLIVGCAALLALGVASLDWPELPTLAVILLLYTNAIGIAVTQHGLPLLAGLLFPAALFVPLAYHLVARRRRFVIGPVVSWMLLFLAAQAFAALLSQDRAYSLAAVATYLAEGLVFYLMIVNVVRSYQVLRLAVWTLLLAGGLLGALALHQQVTGSFGNDYGGFAQVSDASFKVGQETISGTAEQPRLAGSLGQQNHHAQVMLMLLPLGFFLAVRERRRLLTLAATALTLLILVGVGLTFSRGAAVALLLVLIIAAGLGYLRPRQILLLVLGGVVLLQAFPELGLRLTSVTELAELVNKADGGPGLEGADGSTQSRTTEMTAAARVFLDHPVIGVGPSMFRFYYDDYTDGRGLRTYDGERVAHNLYLELAANTGLLGLGSFLGAVGVTLVSLARVRRRCLDRRPELASMATAFLLAIVSYLATGLFLSPAYARYFWLIMALAWATCRLGADLPDEVDITTSDRRMEPV